MDELQLLLDQCLIHARHIRNLSPHYISGVRAACNRFLKHSGAKKLTDCTSYAIEAWLLDGRIYLNWKPATFRSYHRDIGFFFRYLLKRGKVAEDPTLNIELPKLEQQLPKGISLDEAERLLATTKRLKYTYIFETARNVAIIATLLFTGLRKQEVLNLRLENVALDRMTISVIQ